MSEKNDEVLNPALVNPIKQTQDPTVITGICVNCKTELSLPAPPIIHFHNVVVTSISIPHSKGINCSGCGTYYNVAVMRFQAEIALMVQEKPKLNKDKDESRIVLPFGKPSKLT